MLESEADLQSAIDAPDGGAAVIVPFPGGGAAVKEVKVRRPVPGGMRAMRPCSVWYPPLHSFRCGQDQPLTATVDGGSLWRRLW